MFRILKNIIHTILRIFGYDIYKFHRRNASKHSDVIKCYETSTGKYYLPVKAISDCISLTIRNNNIF
jgi:hypothetical protein